MAAPTIYKSSDAGAPVLFNSWGSFVDVLDACLVNGYGGGFATGTLTSDGVNVTDGDTVTVGSKTYTFRNTRAAINDVQIGASAATSLVNLATAINLYNSSSPTLYFLGTTGNQDAWASAVTATVLTIQARVAGTAGNSIALTEVSSHLLASASTLAGGTAGSTKTAAGWTKEFASLGRGVYRPSAGTRCYLDVLDNNPDTTYWGPGARVAGAEVITALGTGIALSTGSGQFSHTITSHIYKRGGTPSLATSTPWLLMADGRTAYFWYWSTDLLGAYGWFAFGDFQSLIAGDAAKTFIASCGNWYTLSQQYNYEYGGTLTTAGSTVTGHYLQRNWSGIISNVGFGKVGDYSRGGGYFQGNLSLPHAPDGGLYVSPVYLFEGSGGAAVQRGFLRGIYQPLHAVSSWSDGDTIPGSGSFAGHTFLVIRPLIPGSTSAQGAMMVDITDWAT